MIDTVTAPPVILLDGLLGSGSSIISNNIGRSYSFVVINGNQYLRDLGRTTGYVTAAKGTLEHELQLLDFYLYIVDNGVDVHDQIYSFLKSKISLAKVPTVVRATGFASYAIQQKIPVKKTFWLHANIEDRAVRLLARHKITPHSDDLTRIQQKLEDLDLKWNIQLNKHLGISLDANVAKEEDVIDTANMPVDLAFQKLATLESFVETYNKLAQILPDYSDEWRRWHCLNCELVLETNNTITQCPRCGNDDPNRFRDAE